MSTELYPIACIARLKVNPQNRVESDEVDSGTIRTRLWWPEKFFRRSFELQHAPLNEAEFANVGGFFQARNGMYDSFWFRDNVNRQGNALVRFVKALEYSRESSAFILAPQLQEVAPIRALPQPYEVRDAAGTGPAVWFDANRERYILHNNAVSLEDYVFDASIGLYTSLVNHNATHYGRGARLDGVQSQYQTFKLGDHVTSGIGPYVPSYAKSANNITVTLNSKPPATIFALVKNATSSAKRVIFACGTAGTTGCLGLAISAANNYEPFIGGSQTWGTANYSNGTPNVWRSIAITWADGSDDAKLYVNGALIGTESETRSWVNGPASLGADSTGANFFSTPAEDHVQHAMLIQDECSLAEIQALHNLFAYQVGLTEV